MPKNGTYAPLQRTTSSASGFRLTCPLWLKRVEQGKTRDPGEILCVARDQRQAMNQCRCRRQRITESHLPSLPQAHGLVEDRIGNRENCGRVEECSEVPPLFVTEVRISENLNLAHG